MRYSLFLHREQESNLLELNGNISMSLYAQGRFLPFKRLFFCLQCLLKRLCAEHFILIFAETRRKDWKTLLWRRKIYESDEFVGIFGVSCDETISKISEIFLVLGEIGKFWEVSSKLFCCLMVCFWSIICLR